MLDAALTRALDPLAERPRLLPSAEITIDSTRWGETFAIATGHRGAPYVRTTAEAGRLALALDGARTLRELAHDIGIDPSDAIEVVDVLRANGVVEGGNADVYDAVRRHTSSASRRAVRWMSAALRDQTLELRDIDRLAGAVHRAIGRVLFSPAAAAASGVVAVTGLAAFLATVRRDGFNLSGPLSGGAAAAIIAIVLASVAVHEFGHALAVKRAGRRVNRAGFQLYFGHPAFFVDSTDLLFASRRERALNAALGPYLDVVTAGIAGLVAWWWGDSGVGTVAGRVAVLTYLNVVLNLVPFVELDGYWLLTDLLDTPRLRTRSLALLRSEVPRRLRARRGAFDRRERALLGFALLGIAFTAAAVAAAFVFWWPLVETIVQTLWRAGLAGRGLTAILVVVAAGPLGLMCAEAVRAIAGLTRSLADAARFRAQKRWRVEAGEAIARLLRHEVDEDVLGELAGLVRRRPVVAGEQVLVAGEGGHTWFVIRRGRFEVADVAGRVLALLTPGDAFGERALLHRGPREAGVRALTDGELFVLDAGAYLRLLAPAVAQSEAIA